ncbi:MAG: hypothetical protein HN337_09030 [Deltaproteobacteria bacterium]|nr:hypothetical protein [Deltaproteobacteria bacterium]
MNTLSTDITGPSYGRLGQFDDGAQLFLQTASTDGAALDPFASGSAAVLFGEAVSEGAFSDRFGFGGFEGMAQQASANLSKIAGMGRFPVLQRSRFGDYADLAGIMFAAGRKPSGAAKKGTTKAAGKAGGSGKTGGPGGPGGPTPPGGGGTPPSDAEIIDLWITELGMSKDPRVTSLSDFEKETLVRIAMRNRGAAKGIVNNGVLANLHLPGITETDQLALTLRLYGTLLKTGVVNNGTYLKKDRNSSHLLDNRPYILAGDIVEMSYLAVAAENAAVNGYRTKAQSGSDVPWDVLPDGLLDDVLKRFPPLPHGKLQKLMEFSSVDGEVVGDRLIEIKLRASGKNRYVYSKTDAGDDETFVQEKLQAIKMIARAKKEGLRGIEFALYGDRIDDNWKKMVIDAAARAGVGVRIALNMPGAVNPIVYVDTMPKMISRISAITISMPPLEVPPPKKRVGKRDEWPVPIGAVEFMLKPVTPVSAKNQAASSPKTFHSNIRQVAAQQIMQGFLRHIDGHFQGLDSAGEADPQSYRSWKDEWGELNRSVTKAGNKMSISLAKKLAEFSHEMQQLIAGDADLMKRVEETRRAFLTDAQVIISQFNYELDTVSSLLETASYESADYVLGEVDKYRDTLLLEQLKNKFHEHGLVSSSPFTIAVLSEMLGRWRSADVSLIGHIDSVTQSLGNYSVHWEILLNSEIPEAYNRWKRDIGEMSELFPSEPFPYETASEFLARFAMITSKGSKRGVGGKTALPDGNWSEVVSLLGLDGTGDRVKLGDEVDATMPLFMDVGKLLYPAELQRMAYALLGFELFHVDDSSKHDGETYYYLPQVYKAAYRMINTVLVGAHMRDRQGKTKLGIGRTFIFPWVITKGKGGQSFWLEVSPGGNSHQLVLERVVVAGESQIPPRLIQELLEGGLRFNVPRGGGGTKGVHFDLAPPVSGDVVVDSYNNKDELRDIAEITEQIIKASFRDTIPKGSFVEGESKFKPVEGGYLTVAEIHEMGLKDAYASSVNPKTTDVFTATRIRKWPDFIDRQLRVMKARGEKDVPNASYFYLKIRTSHRGRRRVLIHMDRVRKYFGEHLRLKRVPGFALATEIAATSQGDVYGVQWTSSRLQSLFKEIEDNEEIPDVEKEKFIRKFRSTAGGSHYKSMHPGQLAINLRELKRSEWGEYYRLRRPGASFTRQMLIKDHGFSAGALEVIDDFIEKHTSSSADSKYSRAEHYVTNIRGYRAAEEKLYHLGRLRDSFEGRLPDEILREVSRVLKVPVSRSVGIRKLDEYMARVMKRFLSVDADIRGVWDQLRVNAERIIAQCKDDDAVSLASARRVVEAFSDSINLGVNFMAMKNRVGSVYARFEKLDEVLKTPWLRDVLEVLEAFDKQKQSMGSDMAAFKARLDKLEENIGRLEQTQALLNRASKKSDDSGEGGSGSSTPPKAGGAGSPPPVSSGGSHAAGVEGGDLISLAQYDFAIQAPDGIGTDGAAYPTNLFSGSVPAQIQRAIDGGMAIGSDGGAQLPPQFAAPIVPPSQGFVRSGMAIVTSGSIAPIILPGASTWDPSIMNMGGAMAINPITSGPAQMMAAMPSAYVM